MSRAESARTVGRRVPEGVGTATRRVLPAEGAVSHCRSELERPLCYCTLMPAADCGSSGGFRSARILTRFDCLDLIFDSRPACESL